MRIRRILASSAAAVMVAGGVLLGAAPGALAEQVWIQQVGRASADAPCDVPAVEDDAAGWSAWGRSWAQWPNDGKGGWVCTRSITWAKDTPPASSCILARPSTYWLDFAGTDWVPNDAMAYGDSACTELTDAMTGVVFVLADSSGAAQSVCDAHGGGTATQYAVIEAGADPRLYFCQRPR
jgi:hypothetical protein